MPTHRAARLATLAAITALLLGPVAVADARPVSAATTRPVSAATTASPATAPAVATVPNPAGVGTVPLQGLIGGGGDGTTEAAVLDGKVWVLDGILQVFGMNGVKQATSPSLVPGHHLTPDPGRHRVFLTGADLSVVDTTTNAVSTWLAGQCPFSAAVAGSTLYAITGCSAPYTLESMSAVDGSGRQSRLSLPDVGRLSVAGTTLLLRSLVASTYRIEADGSLTPLASRNGINGEFDLSALSPDGSWVVATMTNGASTVQRWATDTLTASAQYPPGLHPNAVAVSPTGDRVAVAQRWSSDVLTQTYDVATGQQSARSDISSPRLNGLSPYLSVVESTLSFSPDGSRLYGLLRDQNSPHGVSLMVTTSTAPVAGTLTTAASVTVTYPQAAVLVGVTRPRATVDLVYAGASGPSLSQATDATGHFRFSLARSAFTLLRLEVRRDATHSSVSRPVQVVVRAVATVTMTGRHRTVGGVQHYRRSSTVSATRVPMTVRLRPPHQTIFVLTLQYRDSRGWHTLPGSGRRFTSAVDGTLPVYATHLRAGVRLRATAVSVTDASTAASAVTYSPTFVVD